MDEQPLVLIVDDQADFREIFSHKLMTAGFRTETAESGAAAVQKAAALKPDLVLMDVMMPDMDGATTVLKFKNDPALKDLRIAFLTSLGDPRMDMKGDEKFSEGFGAGAYFKKTDDLDVLVAKVRELLAKPA